MQIRLLLLLPVLLAGILSAGLPRAQAVVLSPLDRASTLPGVASTNNFYDRNDRLDNDAVSSNANPWFDAHGNTRTNGTDRFLYDWANRLTNAVLGGRTVSIAYDAAGHRVRKTVQAGAGAPVTTHYLVDARSVSGYVQDPEENLGLSSRRAASGIPRPAPPNPPGRLP